MTLSLSDVGKLLLIGSFVVQWYWLDTLKDEMAEIDASIMAYTVSRLAENQFMVLYAINKDPLLLRKSAKETANAISINIVNSDFLKDKKITLISQLKTESKQISSLKAYNLFVSRINNLEAEIGESMSRHRGDVESKKTFSWILVFVITSRILVASAPH